MSGARTIVGVCLFLGVAAFAAIHHFSRPPRPSRSIIEVHPGEDIQAALDEAARRSPKAIVQLHAGEYRPVHFGQSLIYFNARHDGIVLEGLGEVTLTAANPALADPGARSYPAVVNHVVYFGDGISSQTILRSVRITGGNGYTDGPPGLIDIQTVDDLNRSAKFRSFESPIETNAALEKSHEFFCDGSGILVYGRSYPTIENVVVEGNYGRVCGGGVSIQHRLESLLEPVRFRHCVFRKNRAAVSGAAIDVFSPGSWVELDNCLLVENENEEKLDRDPSARTIFPLHGFGALSVFPMSRATVRDCTFAFNRSAVDDRGNESTYERCLFWNNSRPSASKQTHYELDVNSTTRVDGCFIHGELDDVHAILSRSNNRFEAGDPEFDGAFRPRNPALESIGYRPEKR